MIIHVIGSLQDKEKDPPALRKIVQVAYDAGSVIATDWIEAAITQLDTPSKDGHVWQPDIDEDIDAIKRSDVVIIEATHYDFNQGFQAGAALHYKKPILIVSREPINGKILSWITDELLIKEEYKNEDELGIIIQNFIRQNIISTKDLRFNLFIDREIHNYLEEVSYETGRNKSEIIRDVITKSIEKGDK